MAFFDTEITDEQITKEMIDEMPSKYQKSVGFYTWDILRAISKSIKQVWDKLTYMSNLDDLRNMTLEDLIVFVEQRRGIKYKYATASNGQLEITNGNGTITKGDIFATPDGTQFQAAETKTVTTGGFITLECLTKGITGNVPENTITVIPTTIAGIYRLLTLKHLQADTRPKLKTNCISVMLTICKNLLQTQINTITKNGHLK